MKINQVDIGDRSGCREVEVAAASRVHRVKEGREVRTWTWLGRLGRGDGGGGGNRGEEE